jgi:phosphatidate cytidylyltransferase
VLKTRVATALVLLALLLAVLFWLPPLAGAGFLLAVVLMGAWEWAAFAGLGAPAARLGYVLATLALCAGGWALASDAAGLARLMQVAALWWGIALLWLSLAPHRITRPAAAIAGLLVLAPAFVGLARLLAQPSPPQGALKLLGMLVIVWAADIGAYFAGRRFGRLKLAPAVSPNKTWEGVLGGVVLALVVALVVARWSGTPALPFAALALAVVCASIVGDLTESLFKRFAGLKDSGGLLPGHGGVLDRIDSITAAVPFYVLGLGWLGRLS